MTQSNLAPLLPTRTGKLLRFSSRRAKASFTPEPNLSKIGKGLIDSEMRKLNDTFSRPKTEAEFRNRALFLLLSSTGLRATEVVNLRFSDKIAITDDGIGFRYRRKGGQDYVTIPSKQAMQAINAYHEKFGIQSEYLLTTLKSNVHPKRQRMTTRTLQRIIDSWNVNRADGRKASPHSFRHTVGQKTFLQAGSIAAQKILGHTSPVITSKFYTLPYFDGSKILKW